MKTTLWCFLGALSAAFLAAPADAAEQRGGAFRDGEIISVLKDYTPSSCKDVGVIQKANGKGILVIVRPTALEAFVGKTGDPVHEKDFLVTVGELYCRVVFKDGNRMILGPDARLGIEEVSKDLLKREKRAVFHQTLGRILFRAIPLFSCPNMTVVLESPLARIHVTGTEFMSGIQDKGGKDAESATGQGKDEQASGEHASAQSYGRVIVDGLVLPVAVHLSPPRFISLQFGASHSFLIDESHTKYEQERRYSDWEARKEQEGLTWYESSFMHEVMVIEGEVDVTSKRDGETAEVKEHEAIRVEMNGLGKLEFNPQWILNFMEGFGTKNGFELKESTGPATGNQAGGIEQMETPGSRGQVEDIPKDVVDPHADHHGHEQGRGSVVAPPCKQP